MKKSMTVVAAILPASSTVLSGCSFKVGSQVEDGKVEIRSAPWDDAEDLDKRQALMDQFNSSHEDIEVTLEACGGEYSTKINAGMSSGDMPNVSYVWDYPSYYEGLEPPDPCIEREGAEYKDNSYDALWPYNSKNDTIHDVPVGFTTHALYYNKDIFTQVGVTEPASDWTWGDVRTAAKTIIDSVGGVRGFSFQMKSDPYNYEIYLWSNGSSFADADGGLNDNLNSANSVGAISLFQEMEKGGYAVATERNGTDEFRGDQTAMHTYGAWAVSTFDEDGLNYGTVDIPAFVGVGRGSVSALNSPSVSTLKDSKDRETAWEFVRY